MLKQTAPCPPTPQRSSRSWWESAAPIYATHDVPDPCSTRGSFCGSSSITNSNWHSWDISKMNPWRAASSCFYFALVLRMSSLWMRPQAPVTAQGRQIQTGCSCLVRTTRSHKISNGMPDCKRLLWSKPPLISFGDANSCQPFPMAGCMRMEMLTSAAFLRLCVRTCLRKSRNDRLDSKRTGWGCLVCGLPEVWTNQALLGWTSMGEDLEGAWGV